MVLSMSFFDNPPPLHTETTLDGPIALTRQVKKRDYITDLQKQSLTDLIPQLPPSDVDIYLITNGSGGTYKTTQASSSAFEFGHFIPRIAELLGNQNVTAYISTWTMNRSHATHILEMLDQGILEKVVLFTDDYFKSRESAVANQLIAGLLERKQTFLTFKNHCKVLGMINHDQTLACNVFSSANFSAQPRTENYILNTDRQCFYWLRDSFFNAMIAKNNG